MGLDRCTGEVSPTCARWGVVESCKLKRVVVNSGQRRPSELVQIPVEQRLLTASSFFSAWTTSSGARRGSARM